MLSKQFREALEDAMIRYTNKQLSTAEMISKLLDLARWVRDAQRKISRPAAVDEKRRARVLRERSTRLYTDLRAAVPNTLSRSPTLPVSIPQSPSPSPHPLTTVPLM